MKTLWFDGESAAAHGLIISGSGTFNAAERDVEMVSIPGRNGDLTIDRGRYKNVPVSYPASIYTDFAANAEKVRAWLGSRVGYCRLEDDYDPDHFRLARFQGPLTFTPGFLNRTAECTIHFDCKPQRFLKSGERAVELGTGGVLYNPTDFPALPLIKVMATAGSEGYVEVENAAGTFRVSITFPGWVNNICLDCENKDAYFDDETEIVTNMNAFISSPVPLAELILAPGNNSISIGTVTGSLTAVAVTPRWWTL